MAATLFYSNILTPGEFLQAGALLISQEGKILYVGAVENAPPVRARRLDLRNLLLVPGFIDVHVHGGNGVTFGSGSDAAQELRAYSEWVVCSGVTGYLCSLAAPDADALISLVRRYAAAMKADVRGAEPLGIHLEGPFLSKEKKGAFDPAWLRLPSLEESEALLAAGEGWIRQVTLAPELPGAGAVAARFRQEGVVVALGHTNSDYETARAALKGNYTHVTHTFNAQSGFHHRQPGAFGAILASEQVTAELIADTIHAHPAAMKVLARCLGAERIVLITDAMAGAGLPDGIYQLVGQNVHVRDGRAALEDGTIAGSTALMNQCVRNLCRLVGVPLAEAIRMASLNPARAMGFAGRLGSLSPGKDASLVAIDEDLNVRLTLVRGEAVYSNL